MYLIIPHQNALQAYQTTEITINSNFLGWVYDESIDVIRFQDGKFEHMVVCTENNNGMMRWSHVWRAYRTQEI